ncbi:MAG: TlpA disulfide reductase family protein [Halobacteriovoraceae bacterium]|nr:TlpA disulfide reductase family protein [Halobacteriovoraceae bacterium]
MYSLIYFVLFSFLPYSYSKDIKDFSLPTYKDNKIFQLSKNLKKYDKILINFWASWCTGCIEELAELEALKNKYKNVLFIAINAGEKKRKIDKFIKKYNFSYLILEDKDRLVSKKLNVKHLPQTIVIDKKKKILFRGDRPPKKI